MEGSERTYEINVICANCKKESVIRLPRGRQFISFQSGALGIGRQASSKECPNCGTLQLVLIRPD